MKSTRWILSALMCILLAGFAQAQDKSKPSQEEMMKAMMAAATPGAPHQQLAAMVGTWDTVVKMWNDPSAPPTESKGTTEMSMVLGGRFLMQQSKAEMMGMPFEGIGYTGYDNVQKKYVSTWMDNMGTGIMNSIGEEDPKTGKVVYAATMWDPMSGKQMTFQEVFTKVAPDHYTFEMFAPGPEGKNVKMMEMSYTKKG